MTQAVDLLQYFASYPKATITYRVSGMIIFVHSDGSFLSEPKAGSRLGVIEVGSSSISCLPTGSSMW
jgi:hypothetical protein